MIRWVAESVFVPGPFSKQPRSTRLGFIALVLLVAGTAFAIEQGRRSR